MTDALRRHPRHVLLAALVAGLLAAPLDPSVVLLLACVALVAAGRPVVGAFAAATVIVGALWGQARLEPSPLSFPFGAVEAPVVLLEQPRPVRYGFTALAALEAGEGERLMLRIGTSVSWPQASTGALVLVRGRLRPLGPFERHYERRGAAAALSLDAAVPTGLARGGAWGFVDGVRTRAERALHAGLPDAQAALLRGMVLGQDEALSERVRDEFRVSGLAHILAASGQNVALLLALALPLLAWSGLGLRGRLLGGLLLIALYVPLAGAGPSIQRAGVMGAATTVAAMAGRPASRWYALLLAAAVTLAVNPRFAGDPGWQLSFAAVVAIALLSRQIAGWLRVHRVPRALADAAAITVSATGGTAPLLALHFHQISTVSVAANLLAAPAIAPIMWLGLIAAAVGQIAPDLAVPLNALNAPLLGYVGWVAHAAAGLPYASVDL